MGAQHLSDRSEPASQLDEETRRIIAGAIAEVDPRQIAIYAKLTPAQRIRQLAHLSDWLRRAERRRREREAYEPPA
jgi:hypothetical protein